MENSKRETMEREITEIAMSLDRVSRSDVSVGAIMGSVFKPLYDKGLKELMIKHYAALIKEAEGEMK